MSSVGGGGDVDMRDFEGRVVDGKYVLRECRGEGGFGAVFLSDQRLFDVPVRRVALKLSRRGEMTPDGAKDVFADAIRLAEAMDSITDGAARRHLVHVFDAGIAADAGNRAFLTMEFVQGTTLAAQFASLKRVSAAQLMKWMTQACTALRGLHTLDPPLLHRDLKPDNVLLGLDNAVRLIDFGLAARLLDLGYVPGVAGTLAYMAPETSQGSSVPASDIYSLGLLVYEGLTGRHPFRHLIPPVDLPDSLYSQWLYDQKRRCPAVPPSSINNTVEPALDAIVLRCLEFNPRLRFHDAAELLDALGRKAKPPSPWEQALRDGRDLRCAGELPGACRAFERGLAARSVPRDDRFLLLRELGETLAATGRPDEAAQRLVEAWRLTESAPILRTRKERAELLAQVADCYREIPNDFQARRYDDLRRRELGGSP